MVKPWFLTIILSRICSLDVNMNNANKASLYCRRLCAADFSLLNLPKGKSLGRSKPATSSYAQALQHTMRKISTISKSYWTAFYRNKMSTINVSELGYLFHDKSSLHIVAWDLDVERSKLCKIVSDDVKSCNTIRISYYKYALTTVKGASVK